MGLSTHIGAYIQSLACAAAFTCAVVLGGCGGVELEGRVFDYAGVSGGAKQKADPSMGARAPLLVPPNLQALPAPTQNRSVAAARQDWPNDPEKVRVSVIEQEKKASNEKPSRNQQLNHFAGKETLLDKLLKPKSTVEEPVADVPEPDASDRIPGRAVATGRGQAPHVPQAPLPDQNNDAFNPAAPESYGKVSQGKNATAGY